MQKYGSYIWLCRTHTKLVTLIFLYLEKINKVKDPKCRWLSLSLMQFSGVIIKTKGYKGLVNGETGQKRYRWRSKKDVFRATDKRIQTENIKSLHTMPEATQQRRKEGHAMSGWWSNEVQVRRWAGSPGKCQADEGSENRCVVWWSCQVVIWGTVRGHPNKVKILHHFSKATYTNTLTRKDPFSDGENFKRTLCLWSIWS